MSVKGRLKNFVEHQNMTISAFEKSISASNGYVNSISKSIGLDKMNDILEIYPKLNIEWLITGKGKMLKFDPYTSENLINEEEVEYNNSVQEKVKFLEDGIKQRDKLIDFLERENNELRQKLNLPVQKNRIAK